MFWKNPETKKLIDEWNERLAKEGLPDPDQNIETHELSVFRKASWTERHARRDYYLALYEYIHHHNPVFDSDVDYFIMHKFSLGYNRVEIYRILQQMDCPRHKKTIMYVRRKYENRWGIREWTPEQLRSSPKKKD